MNEHDKEQAQAVKVRICVTYLHRHDSCFEKDVQRVVPVQRRMDERCPEAGKAELGDAGSCDVRKGKWIAL